MAESLGKTSETFAPDTLIAGSFPRAQKKVIIKSGSGEVVRGTLLGDINKELGDVEPDAGNTGNGTIGSAALKKFTKLGQYVIEMLTATTFFVKCPDGYRLLPDGATGSLYEHPELDFQITVGGTPMVAGDKFYFNVDEPSTIESEKSALASVDGSQFPNSILGADVDATSEAITTWAYLTGQFSEDDMVFGTGHTAANTKEALRDKNIYLEEKTKLNPNFPP